MTHSSSSGVGAGRPFNLHHRHRLSAETTQAVEENAAVQFVKRKKDLLCMPSITRDGFDLVDVVSMMVDAELHNHPRGVEMTLDIGLSFFLL